MQLVVAEEEVRRQRIKISVGSGLLAGRRALPGAHRQPEEYYIGGEMMWRTHSCVPRRDFLDACLRNALAPCDALNKYEVLIMKTTFFATVALLCPLAAWAADDIKPFDAKPGLWETTTTMETSGLPGMPQIPEEQLAKMTPQQRAQVEAMLKARGGGGAPRTSTNKSCLTQDSFRQAMAMGQNENCTRKVTASSSSMQNIHMECTQGKMNMTGDLMVERVDAEHAKGSVVMKSAAADQGMSMKMSFNAKWLSADCGDVKPLVVK